ncbi:hypothetical protein GUITHDRAFT_150869 [Guillardia theta CCMP2712]|uniref:RWP-RK domain-containing protein n=1 Tax=Guillardia theta (strain CCMP2712) TaxID=905079 RepID=L1JUA9_GUITC|nr:hypothetical protein GUITHDRAFT_150869 [Guillardia theta CCMP2712]EKX52007.1 hypothetical protein GUITHDRAFT_150869 [Guillardia theta CCMP2712]|eukprot:XP_005838987.1 hypothetical protein GUITHDRAFT_150869 [Guillardia theta CCMP2712]
MANPLLPTFPLFIPQQPILFPVAPKPTNTIPTPVLLALLENMKNMNTLLSMSNMRQPVNTFTQFQPIPETRPMETEQSSEPSTEMCSEHNSDEEVEDKQVTKSDSVSVKVQVRNSRTTARSEPIEITYEQLAKHFHRSLESAASSIGIGKSTMKVVCRRLGIKKWPYTHKGQRRRRPSKKIQASVSLLHLGWNACCSRRLAAVRISTCLQ